MKFCFFCQEEYRENILAFMRWAFGRLFVRISFDYCSKERFLVLFLAIALIVACCWLFRRQLARDSSEVRNFMGQIPEVACATMFGGTSGARIPPSFFFSEFLLQFFSCIRLCPMMARPRERQNVHLQHLWDTSIAQRDYQRLDGEQMPSRSGIGEI